MANRCSVIVLLLLCLCYQYSYAGRPAKVNSQAIEAVVKILKAWEQKDTATLNTLIHPDHNIIILHRIGATNTRSIISNLQAEQLLPFQPYLKDLQLQPELTIWRNKKEPNFNCTTEQYAVSDLGIYLNSVAASRGNNLYSETLIHLEQ